MASVKIVHFKSKVFNDGTSPILLRIIIDRKVRYYKLGDTFKCKYYPKKDKKNDKDDPRYKWDDNKGVFKSNYPNYKSANRNLHKKLGEAEDIIIELENKKPHFTHDDFRRQFVKDYKVIYLLEYMDTIISRLKESSQVGNANVYQTCRNIFAKFLNNKDILITSIDLKFLNLFIEKSYQEGRGKTTISNYLRTLRAVCRKAMKEEGLEYYPFQGFDRWKEFKETTDKRALTKEEMLKMVNYKTHEGSDYFNAIKYFTFMYVTYGLNFADMAKLTTNNIKKVDGVTIIKYNRSKGGKKYEIPLDETGLSIIEYYKKVRSEYGYLFPILHKKIHKTPEQIRTRIKTVLKKVNKDLQDIAGDIGIEHNVTTYVARHTFATVLYKDGENPGMISEMLGHSNLQTTLTYLKSFDYSDKLEAGKKLL